MRYDHIDMDSLLTDICDNLRTNSKVYENYSGRGMYGKRCWGIVTSNMVDCIETAACKGLTGAETDSMGLQSIVYWPRPHFTDELEEQYSLEESTDEEE